MDAYFWAVLYRLSVFNASALILFHQLKPTTNVHTAVLKCMDISLSALNKKQFWNACHYNYSVPVYKRRFLNLMSSIRKYHCLWCPSSSLPGKNHWKFWARGGSRCTFFQKETRFSCRVCFLETLLSLQTKSN